MTLVALYEEEKPEIAGSLPHEETVRKPLFINQKNGLYQEPSQPAL